MGLSASQARLLSLTARQSNLEFEGQQINQQRTTLSNQSSNYYNTLLEMDVPVPPSTNDYTKIVYTFMIGGNEATVKEALPENQINGTAIYTVTYTTNLSTIGIKENSAYKTSASSEKKAKNIMDATSAYHDDINFYLSAMNRVDNTSNLTANDTQYILLDTEPSDIFTNTNIVIMGSNGYRISPDVYKKSKYELDGDNIKTDSNDNKILNKDYKEEDYKIYCEKSDQDGAKQKYALSYTKVANELSYNYYKNDVENVLYEETNQPTDNNDKFVYTYKSSNGNPFTTVDPQYADSFVNAGLDMDDYYQYETSSGIRFVKRDDVEGNLNNQSVTVMTSAVGTINVTTKNTMTGATIEFDSSGRISTITDEEGNTYTMTATTETDNDAYDDAYNQYEYNQYMYDKKQQEINASIEILQAQDKSLELRLSTLDTQHTAIQTELEAVKKVMSKNIDNSFKTFNA